MEKVILPPRPTGKPAFLGKAKPRAPGAAVTLTNTVFSVLGAGAAFATISGCTPFGSVRNVWQVDSLRTRLPFAMGAALGVAGLAWAVLDDPVAALFGATAAVALYGHCQIDLGSE